MKHRLLAIVIILSLLLSGCGGAGMQGDNIDIANMVTGTGIVTASDLIEFIKNGDTDTATLLAPIDLGNEMLKITSGRGPIIIMGNGCAINSAADCVIRIDSGCELTLNNVSIEGRVDGIGCLGDADIGGSAASITAGNSAIMSKGKITIAPGSELKLIANTGSALTGKGITLLKGAKITSSAGLNAVCTTKNDLVLYEDAELHAVTSTNYNAVKCEDRLVMKAGSVFDVENTGDYHGAEIDSISVEGPVNIYAKGGSKGIGVFIFTHTDDICVIGECTPGPQFENGRGSITFVKDISGYNDWAKAKSEVDAEAETQKDAEETEG
ncbi:MAG: hypothetical protein RR527_04315 [Clostridia bacterium]